MSGKGEKWGWCQKKARGLLRVLTCTFFPKPPFKMTYVKRSDDEQSGKFCFMALVLPGAASVLSFCVLWALPELLWVTAPILVTAQCLRPNTCCRAEQNNVLAYSTSVVHRGRRERYPLPLTDSHFRKMGCLMGEQQGHTSVKDLPC